MIFDWNVEPAIFYKEIFGFPLQIRYYSIFFLLGILSIFHFLKKACVWEGKTLDDMDNLMIISVVATVVGARLGHILFYEPQHFFSWTLFKVWRGGLASHGAAISIPIGVYLFSRKSVDKSFLWLMDRVGVSIPFAGALIRIGNFFNSEIYGKPTDGTWGVVFQQLHEGEIPRHPTQLYEATAYFLMFAILYWLYKTKKNLIAKEGFLFGSFLILCFGFRFFIEFFKANQVGFEAGMALNMGQILSIPAVLIGIVLVFRKK